VRPTTDVTVGVVDCDLVSLFDLQEGAYLLKPSSFDDYIGIAQRIRELWQSSHR
jgi:hypothetical protein